jgi:hypothetical protein
MAEATTTRRGGGFQRFVLWLVIIGLLGAVFWLASERNEHRFHITSQGNALVIERGRFFPTGSAPVPPTDKVYGPLPVPPGEKVPADVEFDSQNSLDRWMFDLLSAWARNAGKRSDNKSAAALVDRASALPGLTGAQVAELSALRADLSWDDAQGDLANAAGLVEAARRKLEAVRQGNGAHAADAAALSGKLEGVQRTLRDLGKQQ